MNEDKETLSFEEILTPEEEAKMLVKEFNEFAEHFGKAIPKLPDTENEVKDKVAAMCAALRALTEEDMIKLFKAMDN